MTRSRPSLCLYWNVTYGKSRSEERHGASCRVRESIRQQVQELSEMPRSYSPKARSEILNWLSGHKRSQAIVERVSVSPQQRSVRAVTPSTHHHLVTSLEHCQESGNVAGIMLSVSIHEDNYLAPRMPSTCLDCCPIPHAARV